MEQRIPRWAAQALDCSKAETEFGFKAEVDLEEGLQSTIDWYKEVRNAD